MPLPPPSVCPRPPARAPTDRPNLILINCDDLGFGDLACFGSSHNQTPHLDRLAADGVRFTSLYAASAVCSPSRAAMLTGCYPKRIGFADFDGGSWVLFPGSPTGLHPSEVTLAQLLEQQGYATKIVGKWHCGDQPCFLPTNYGFQHYYGIPYSNDMGRQAGREPLQLPPLPLVRDRDVIEEQPDQASLTSRYLEECLRFVRAHQNTPFFLYLAHLYVHLPLYVPDRFVKESRNGRYGAAVACIDWCTGALRRELHRLGLEHNTLLVFTSDNGSRCRGEGGSNHPFRGTKATTWEGGQRVPGIAAWPGQIPSGSTCDTPLTHMDFLPTFATLCGAPVPDDRILDGQDVSFLFRGETDAQSIVERPFCYYFREALCAMRVGQWKLHFARDQTTVAELFNLATDPGETRECSAAEPAIVLKLQRLADSFREDLGDSLQRAAGSNCRPPGKVEARDARPLTCYDPSHPYYIAEYDLSEAG